MGRGGLGLIGTELVYAACPWGDTVDFGECWGFVSYQLWPTRAELGFKTIEDEAVSVRCSHGQKRVTIAPGPDEKLVEHAWIDDDPPLLLVTTRVIEEGSDDTADHWAIYQDCAAKPVETGGVPTPGLGDWWISEDAVERDEGDSVYATALGEIAGSPHVAFREPR